MSLISIRCQDVCLGRWEKGHQREKGDTWPGYAVRRLTPTLAADLGHLRAGPSGDQTIGPSACKTCHFRALYEAVAVAINPEQALNYYERGFHC